MSADQHDDNIDQAPEAGETPKTPDVAEAADTTAAPIAQDALEQSHEEANEQAQEGALESGALSEATADETEGVGAAVPALDPSVAAEALAELRRLAELSTRYPEIGASVAQLALTLGHSTLGKRILEAGGTEGFEGVDFRFLAADLARREGHPAVVLEHVLGALADYAKTEEPTAERDARLLHLVRLGFAVLLFDLGQVQEHAEWLASLASALEPYAERFAKDAFYTTLYAQALWTGDAEASEATWERAVAMGDPESSWNARGTWYKEALGDAQRAAETYRKGLEAVPASALLMHNLAQVLMQMAEAPGIAPKQARYLLNDARQLVRQAMRLPMRRSLRGHIQETRTRLEGQAAQLPPPPAPRPKPPKAGDVVTGQVRNITPFGAFVQLEGGFQGLVHVSEIAWERTEDPAKVLEPGQDLEVKVLEVEKREGQKGVRIALSRKALLPAPERSEQRPSRPANPAGGGERPPRSERPRGPRPQGAAPQPAPGEAGATPSDTGAQGAAEPRPSRPREGRPQDRPQGGGERRGGGDRRNSDRKPRDGARNERRSDAPTDSGNSRDSARPSESFGTLGDLIRAKRQGENP